MAFGIRFKLIVGLLAIFAIAAIVHIMKSSDDRATKSDEQLGIDSARTLNEVFADTNDLRVAILTADVIAKGSDPGYRGWFPAKTVIKYPFTVDYFVKLSGLDPSKFRWNSGTKTMTVQVPDVYPAKPNVDAARAKVLENGGWWVSRDAAQRMIVKAATNAALRADFRANRPERLEEARTSARRAVQNIVSAPLRAAHLGQINVVVVFPKEPFNDRSGVIVRWDESKSRAQVLEDLQ